MIRGKRLNQLDNAIWYPRRCGQFFLQMSQLAFALISATYHVDGGSCEAIWP